MEHHIEVRKRARYFTSRKMDESIREVWIVLHGYGQLAEYFLKKFEPLFARERLFVAPEGFHRYYLKGYTGRVGASWMTREDRLSDIADYVDFLNDVKNEVATRAGTVRWNVLGFSQGAATAVRWISGSSLDVARLVLWAGSFPPDIDLEQGRSRLNQLDLNVVIGSEDEFFDEGKVVAARQWLQEQGITFQFSSFEGKHDIPPGALTSLYSQWQER